MRCSVSYFIELKGGQARANTLAAQQYDQVVVLRTVAALCARSVLAFLKMSAAVGLLQSHDDTLQSIVHTQKIERSSDSVGPIYRYCLYVVHGQCDLQSTCTRPIPCFTLTHEAPLCVASPLSLARQSFPHFYDFSTILLSLSRSRVLNLVL